MNFLSVAFRFQAIKVNERFSAPLHSAGTYILNTEFQGLIGLVLYFKSVFKKFKKFLFCFLF